MGWEVSAMHRSPQVRLIACFGLAVLLLFTFARSSAQQKPVRGKVQKNVYFSPVKNFNVPVPRGFHISDSHYSSYGVVSFHDDFGYLRGIHYSLTPPETLAKMQQGADACKLVSAWISDFMLPTWFKPVSQQSRVLSEECGTFEDMPAVFALIDAPGANTLEQMSIANGKRESKRLDSRRVAVAFLKDRYTYMLTWETVTIGFFRPAPPPAEPEGDWMARTDELKPFYRSISFLP